MSVGGRKHGNADVFQCFPSSYSGISGGFILELEMQNSKNDAHLLKSETKYVHMAYEP